MSIKRMGNKNPVVAKNFVAPQAELRRTELQRARQNFQQNSFLVDSPSIIYYQQIRNGYVCTCHGAEKPEVVIENHIITVAPELNNYSDKVTEVSFSTISKKPMFGSLPVENEFEHGHDGDEDLLLDDTETPEKPLFSNLFHKGTDCGICFRAGYVPLLNPIGRQFYSLTSLNYVELDGYYIDTLKNPHTFMTNMDRSAVTFKFNVPKYYKSVRYAVYNNTTHLPNTKLHIDPHTILTSEWLNLARGESLHIQVIGTEFTHVFIEFDLGIETKANFPQFSISKDFSYFFNLQQVTIELPPSICNPQVNDLIYVDTWQRLWLVFDVQPKYEGPLQTVLLGTTVQGRLVQAIETYRLITCLKTLD